jgi:hypothetical protein
MHSGTGAERMAFNMNSIPGFEGAAEGQSRHFTMSAASPLYPQYSP